MSECEEGGEGSPRERGSNRAVVCAASFRHCLRVWRLTLSEDGTVEKSLWSLQGEAKPTGSRFSLSSSRGNFEDMRASAFVSEGVHL